MVPENQLGFRSGDPSFAKYVYLLMLIQVKTGSFEPCNLEACMICNLETNESCKLQNLALWYSMDQRFESVYKMQY
jgi:hypothetical protein